MQFQFSSLRESKEISEVLIVIMRSLTRLQQFIARVLPNGLQQAIACLVALLVLNSDERFVD